MAKIRFTEAKSPSAQAFSKLFDVDLGPGSVEAIICFLKVLETNSNRLEDLARWDSMRADVKKPSGSKKLY
jgi:hypothetical protein